MRQSQIDKQIDKQISELERDIAVNQHAIAVLKSVQNKKPGAKAKKPRLVALTATSSGGTSDAP